MKKWISAALAAVLVLSMFGGCANSNTEMDSTNISSDNASISQSTAETTETDSVQAGSDMFTERDYRTEYDESGSVQIQLNGDSATQALTAFRFPVQLLQLPKRLPTLFPAHWTMG